MTDEEKITRWAYLNCERDNVKWIDSAIDVCPLKGNCPACKEKAKNAIIGDYQ
jgi:hypothetical protein